MAVRRQVEELARGRVRRALRIWGGYAPSPTFRLILDRDTRLVFKGVNADSNDHMHRALAAEERVYRQLEPWIQPWAPVLYGSFREAGWHVLLLEDLGRANAPPWTMGSTRRAMQGYAEFHRHSLGQELPDWLPRTTHHMFARAWTELSDDPAHLHRMAALAGARAPEALAWTSAHLPQLASAAEALLDIEPPHALLHLDTRSDNLRLQQGGRLRLFDWPYACVGPPELDAAAFAQSIQTEGGPDADEVLGAYANHVPMRHHAVDGAVAALAGYFASRAPEAPIPGLPRVRAVQRRQLKTSLAWCARRLSLSSPDWLAAVPG